MIPVPKPYRQSGIAARTAARLRSAYTLIEVLAAAAVIAVGMAAAVTLSSTLMIQEELAWRVAVVRNYQENMARLWQLGIGNGPLAAEVRALMPEPASNDFLALCFTVNPSINAIGTTNPSGLAQMERAIVSATVNISLDGDPRVKVAGSASTFYIYRPALPASIRPPRP
jgi:prepilin-type N-terminal cleavage/methylation domain-containing protein